jgi:hypothetical protein
MMTSPTSTVWSPDARSGKRRFGATTPGGGSGGLLMSPDGSFSPVVNPAFGAARLRGGAGRSGWGAATPGTTAVRAAASQPWASPWTTARDGDGVSSPGSGYLSPSGASTGPGGVSRMPSMPAHRMREYLAAQQHGAETPGGVARFPSMPASRWRQMASSPEAETPGSGSNMPRMPSMPAHRLRELLAAQEAAAAADAARGGGRGGVASPGRRLPGHSSRRGVASPAGGSAGPSPHGSRRGINTAGGNTLDVAMDSDDDDALNPYRLRGTAVGVQPAADGTMRRVLSVRAPDGRVLLWQEPTPPTGGAHGGEETEAPERPPQPPRSVSRGSRR